MTKQIAGVFETLFAMFLIGCITIICIGLALGIYTGIVYLLWMLICWGFPTVPQPHWVQAFVIGVVFAVISGPAVTTTKNQS